MSPSRIVLVGRGRRATSQIITTRTVAGEHPGFTEVHDHITLETPKAHSDTAKLRILSLKDAGKVWP